jgi:CyaY protein
MKARRPADIHVIDEVDKLASPRFIHPILATMSNPSLRSELSDAQYSHMTSTLLAGVEATLDSWLQDDVIDIDSARTGGLLEMSFPNGSKIVINTQPPLHEVWLAARSGGYHFKFEGGRWIDTKDRRDFYEALSVCSSEQAGLPLRFSVSA